MMSTPERTIRFPAMIFHCQSRYMVIMIAVNAIKNNAA